MRSKLIFLISIFPTLLFAQINLPEISGESDWEKVIVTRNTDDIQGLTRVSTVKGEAMKIYGKQSKLRAKATEQLQREAAKKGASIVLITLDNFEMTPLNNVNMEATAYKASIDDEEIVESDQSTNSIDLPVVTGEDDWNTVILTRNPDDVKGLTRVSTVKGEAMKIYGKQSKLRAKAYEQMQREAAKQGASIILISLDNFNMTPLNNVNMEGTAYKK